MTFAPDQRKRPTAAAHLADLDSQLVDIFFDRAPMGIAVFDRERRLVRCNEMWKQFFMRYHALSEDYVRPGKGLFELLPGTEADLEPAIAAVLSGETVRQEAFRLDALGVTTYWDVVFAPTYQDGEVSGFVDVVTDATERVKTYELLQQRIAAFATVAESMTVDQPISDTLQALVQTATSVTQAHACAVVVVDASSNVVSIFESFGLPDAYGKALAESWRRGVQSPSRDALERQQLTVVEAAREKGLANPQYEPLYPYLREASWDDMVIVPLDSRGRCLGVMQYYHRAGRQHDAEERAFLTAIADQAALAVANADLYSRSERAAALVERQRLARELHDSVSQALFSMTLHARTAERQLSAVGVDAQAPATATVRRLAELTQGALAEMRALIFELRPGALAEEGLVTALTRQAAALTARESVPITVSGPAERPALDPAAEEHLYRLTLEALNNAVKHAKAAAIAVNVTSDSQALTICISDDGVGFDPAQPHPGHMGQQTMAERAAALGGTLSVMAAPGSGCRVTVVVPHRG